ncbi:MAG TPA: FAD/NAD(P)-binding protein [Pyrinomonadaceae bacterium]|jgi:protoporphyrinogen oxidase
MIGTLDRTRREVTVVGAGIAGLLAAYALDRQGYEVTLLERAPRAGGLIRTRRSEYGLAEAAAHSLLVTPQVAEFCRELGVELVDVRKDARALHPARRPAAEVSVKRRRGRADVRARRLQPRAERG